MKDILSVVIRILSNLVYTGTYMVVHERGRTVWAVRMTTKQPSTNLKFNRLNQKQFDECT